MRIGTVCFLLKRENGGRKLLLGKRDSLFCDETWNGPGGKLEFGEKIEDCAIRETWEEVGVWIDPGHLCWFARVDYRHPHPGGIYGYEPDRRVHF